ncbi:MAG: glycosyltransferase [Saprospiraceae bacterium]|nr:glycosyltransferase [Saprospiraceae bacterium]
MAYLLMVLWLIHKWNKDQNNAQQFQSSHYKTKVSVLIAARNEEKNIKQCLELILAQDYPSSMFEVLVVDDQSDDYTPDIVEEIKDPRIKMMRLGVYKRTTIQGSKKKAIAYGVSHATGDLIITTDADCKVGPTWISTIVAAYEKQSCTLMILPVEIIGDQSTLGIFQSLDSMSTFFIQKSAHDAGFFQLGSAANLAFERKVFLETDPYDDNMQIASGDDMFLIKKINQQYKGTTLAVKSPATIVQTIAVKSISDLFSQRLRWASKLKKAGSPSLMLSSAFVWWAKILSFVAPIFLFFLGNQILFYSSLALLTLQMGLDFTILYKASGFFHKRKLMWYFLPMEILYFFYLFILGILSWLPFQLEWKDRMIKV